jgi:hypothetical protein
MRDGEADGAAEGSDSVGGGGGDAGAGKAGQGTVCCMTRRTRAQDKHDIYYPRSRVVFWEMEVVGLTCWRANGKSELL